MRDLLGELRGRALWVVVGCFVCQMGLGLGYAIGPLASGILAEFGWSRALFASALAPQSLVIALASPLVGWLVDRRGARAVLSAGALVLGGAYLAIASMEAWWQFALAMGLVGLGVTGLGDISVGAVVSQWTSRSRGLALGIVYTGSNLGGFVATRGMAGVADLWSWRHAFAVAAAACLVLLLPAGWLAVRDRAQPVDEPAPEPVPGEGGEPEDLDLAAALRTRSFWILALGLLVFWAYLYALLGHFALALEDGGLSRSEAAGHWSNAVAMGLVSKIAFGALADRIRAKPALLLDFGLLTLSSLLLLAAPGGAPWAVWSFVLCFGFSYAARDVVTPLIVVHCFGARHLAKLYGLLMLTILPGSNLGGILTGWAHDVSGSYAVAFAGLAVANGVALLALATVRDERRRGGRR